MLATIEDTRRIASMLAGKVLVGDCIALSGEVGAGKTTFAQAFIGSLLCKPENITSPTFNLVQSYETTRGWRVTHADLYRLKNPAELSELGLQDAFENQVTLIEWPEMAEGHLPKDALHVRMEYIAENSRRLTLESTAPRWQNFLEQATL